MLNQAFHSNSRLDKLIALLQTIGVFSIIAVVLQDATLDGHYVFLLGFSVISLIFVGFEKRAFMPFFLMSTYFLIATWRLTALASLTYLSYFYLFIFILILIQFALCIRNNLKGSVAVYSRFEWQLVFVRLYLGYDLVLHFTEKLFAGSLVRADDLSYFSGIGLHDPLFFVLLAGLIELAGSFSLACGFFTRLGSVCLFIYLMVATILGGHFHNGFIWANAGGGWEYPVLWSVLILSFAWNGANSFSLDAWIKEKIKNKKAYYYKLFNVLAG